MRKHGNLFGTGKSNISWEEQDKSANPNAPALHLQPPLQTPFGSVPQRPSIGPSHGRRPKQRVNTPPAPRPPQVNENPSLRIREKRGFPVEFPRQTKPLRSAKWNVNPYHHGFMTIPQYWVIDMRMICVCTYRFQKWGVPKNGCFIVENPIERDDLRVPPF